MYNECDSLSSRHEITKCVVMPLKSINRSSQVQSLWAFVDLGVTAMKEYSSHNGASKLKSYL